MLPTPTHPQTFPLPGSLVDSGWVFIAGGENVDGPVVTGHTQQSRVLAEVDAAGNRQTHTQVHTQVEVGAEVK